MVNPGSRPDSALTAVVRAIVVGDSVAALRLLTASPALARTRVDVGATRQAANPYYLNEIEHYLYAGDTVLHVAAAAYQREFAQKVVALGADVRARNRRGAEPLHYAVDGVPGSTRWNPARGSTAMQLATQNTGRGGTGSPEAKAQQAEIVRLLELRCLGGAVRNR
jgi:hypothetical protein